MLVEYLAQKARHSRRQLAYKIGLDWHMPTLGYIIDYDRNRHAYPESIFRDYDRRADQIHDPVRSDPRKASKHMRETSQLPLW